MNPAVPLTDSPLVVNSTEPAYVRECSRPHIGLLTLWLSGFVAHLLWGAWAEPALTIDVRAEKNELVRVLFNFGVGFADRAAADSTIRAGVHRLRIPLPADSRTLQQLEIAPVLAGGPTTVERITLGFPGRERVWDSSTGFDTWRLPDASPETFVPGKPLNCVSSDLTRLLLLPDVPAVVDLSPRLYRRRIALIALGWVLVGAALVLIPRSSWYWLGAVTTTLGRPDHLFAVLGPIGCAVFLLINPPLQSADESGHLIRAWLLSDGQWMPDIVDGVAAGRFPKDLRLAGPDLGNTSNRLDPRLLAQWREIRIDASALTTKKFQGVGIHSTVPYIPQAIGLWIARWFTDYAVAFIHAGRLANAIICGGLVWLAIRLAGRFGWAFLAVALLPQFLHQLSSLSADALTNAMAFLGAAIIFHWRETKHGPIPGWQQAGYVGVVTLLAWCKSVYFGWPILLLLVPTERFGSARRRVTLFVVAAGLAFGSFLLWSQLVKAYWPDPHSMTGDVVSRSQQLALVTANPIWFLDSIIRSLVRFHQPLVTQLVGTFCFANVPLPPFAVFVCVGMLSIGLFAVRVEGESRPLSLRERGIPVSLFAASFVLTCLGLYLWWTPLGSRYIEGIQGRYLLPLLPLLAIACDARRLPVLPKDWRVTLVIGVTAIGLYATSAWTIWNRFYGL
jgi:hypothetical protein